jgi:uncharacterized protein (TIGR01777 family)
MRVLVSGSRGLIGAALIPVLQQAGHDVAQLVRPGTAVRPGDVLWDIDRHSIDRAALDGFDAVVHLAGEPILGRWTTAKKRRIRTSRLGSTALVAEALASLPRRPRVLVCASASGYYGDRGDELLTEASPAGSGFLAEVCGAWEAAAAPARAAGIRVVHVRTGLALSAHGGLLRPMLLPFRLGVGGPIGRGRQYWSWIAIDDLVDAFRFALETSGLDGAVNAAAPNPVTNAEFSRILGRVLRRPALLPVPPLALRLIFGRDAANEAMLTGARLVPARLLAMGFRFRYPELEAARTCGVRRHSASA